MMKCNLFVLVTIMVVLIQCCYGENYDNSVQAGTQTGYNGVDRESRNLKLNRMIYRSRRSLRGQLIAGSNNDNEQTDVAQQLARGQLAFSPLQQMGNNQGLFVDEHAMQSQLPELIAQARNDKTIERALLKMLINASLRSALNNMQSSSSAQSNLDNGLDGVIIRGSSPGSYVDYANNDDLIGQSLQRLPGIDKREYTKPCSFNAVSCAREMFLNKAE